MEGFNPKRDWKRIDPEPPKPCSSCEWRPWETHVWIATGVLGGVLLANILAAVTA